MIGHVVTDTRQRPRLALVLDHPWTWGDERCVDFGARIFWICEDDGLWGDRLIDPLG
jgi:hypothetical protein